MSVSHYLSGSGGGSLFIDPSGKGFSHSEERWGGLVDATNNNAWIAIVTEALGDLAHLGGIP